MYILMHMRTMIVTGLGNQQMSIIEETTVLETRSRGEWKTENWKWKTCDASSPVRAPAFWVGRTTTTTTTHTGRPNTKKREETCPKKVLCLEGEVHNAEFLSLSLSFPSSSLSFRLFFSLPCYFFASPLNK